MGILQNIEDALSGATSHVTGGIRDWGNYIGKEASAGVNTIRNIGDFIGSHAPQPVKNYVQDQTNFIRQNGYANTVKTLDYASNLPVVGGTIAEPIASLFPGTQARQRSSKQASLVADYYKGNKNAETEQAVKDFQQNLVMGIAGGAPETGAAGAARKAELGGALGLDAKEMAAKAEPFVSNVSKTLPETIGKNPSAVKENAPFVETNPSAIDTARGLVTNGTNKKGVNGLVESVKDSFQGWVNSTKSDTLGFEAQKIKKQFSPLDDYAKDVHSPNAHKDQQFIRFQFNKPVDATESQMFQGLRDYFDAKHNQLNAAGIPVAYQENYLKQLWSDTTPELTEKVNRALSLHPGLTREKVITDYVEGIKAGLTPRYTNLSDIATAYERESNRAIADTKFFREGIEKGLFQPKPFEGSDALYHFPGQTLRYEKNGKVVEHTGMLYAPKEFAEPINNYMAQPKILNEWADTSSELKNIVLSGGFPGTSWNFHGFTTLGRDALTAGNPLKMVRNVATDFLAMTYNPLNKKFMAENLDRITELLHAGMTLSTEAPAIAEGASKKGLVANIYDTGKGVMEDPLFKGFIPATKSRFAIEAMDNFMKRGLGREEASKIAAESANTIFGGNNLAELGANKDAQNVLRSIFLAPDTYRSLGKTGVNSVRSLLNPRNPKYWAYRSIALNTAAIYTVMNLVNKQTSGHYMYQNAPGHTFEIEAGTTAEGKTRYIRPLAQALDFVKLPIDVITSIKNGDLNQVGRIVSNRLTPALSQMIQLAYNVNPFGQPITESNDTIPQKLLKYGANIVAGVTPQAVGAAVRYATGQTTPEEAIAQAIELPVRYGSKSSSFFNSRDKALQGLSDKDAKVVELLTMSNKDAAGDPIKVQGSQAVAANFMLNRPDVFKAMQQIAQEDSGAFDPVYSNSLSKEQRQLVLSARSGNQSDRSLLEKQKWYPSFKSAEEKYYAELPQSKATTTAQGTPVIKYPEPSPEIQPLLDRYNATAPNSKNRELLTINNPGLAQYLQQVAQYQIGQRQALSLPPSQSQIKTAGFNAGVPTTTLAAPGTTTDGGVYIPPASTGSSGSTSGKLPSFGKVATIKKGRKGRVAKIYHPKSTKRVGSGARGKGSGKLIAPRGRKVSKATIRLAAGSPKKLSTRKIRI